MDNKLFYYRKVKGLRQFELGRAVDLKEQTISAIETGRIRPSIDTAKRIAKVLGVRVKDIFPSFQKIMTQKGVDAR